MTTGVMEIKVKGKAIRVPSARIQGRTVVVIGTFFRKAQLLEEEWQEEGIADPASFLAELRQAVKADLFTFAQKLPDTDPKYGYHFEWDNLAAIRTASYREWWERQLPQVTRKSVRRSMKRGVVAGAAEFNDELVNGIIGIHNDTVTRQGVPFSHYGKGFSVVKRDYGTYSDRSTFIGAYFEEELIGIIKMVHMGQSANIMQICTKTRHYDKRPTNILIAKAVEICEQKKIPFLVFGKYYYGNKTNSSLTEFKRRNGFEKIDLPRYYVPLTPTGAIAIRMNIHLGLVGMLPGGVINALRAARSKYYAVKFRLLKADGEPQNEQQNEEEESGKDEESGK